MLGGEVERARLLHAGNALLHQRRALVRQRRADGRVGDACLTSAENTPPQAVQHTSGWLTPLQSLTPADKQPPAPQSLTQRLSIDIQPDIALAVLKREMAAQARIWWLCRHLDADGRGVITVARLREALCEKRAPLRVVGWRRMRQLLRDGSGTFWERDNFDRLWLYGRGRVATALGVTYLRRKTVALDINALCGTIGGVRAHLHATFHAARGRDGGSDAPISRATIADVTGVPQRTQQHYEHVAHVARQQNISIAQPQTASNRQSYVSRHGRAAFTLVDKQGKFGRINQPYNARRLPNSYQTPLRCRQASSVRRHNRRLHTLVHNQGQGTVQPPAYVSTHRHYFTDARLALRSKLDQPVYLKPDCKAHWIEVAAHCEWDVCDVSKG